MSANSISTSRIALPLSRLSGNRRTASQQPATAAPKFAANDLPKAERLELFKEAILRARPARNFHEAVKLTVDTLLDIEVKHANGYPMQAPLEKEYFSRVEGLPQIRISQTIGQMTLIGENGAIEIRQKGSRSHNHHDPTVLRKLPLFFSKPGADRKTIWQQDPPAPSPLNTEEIVFLPDDTVPSPAKPTLSLIERGLRHLWNKLGDL